MLKNLQDGKLLQKKKELKKKKAILYFNLRNKISL